MRRGLEATEPPPGSAVAAVLSPLLVEGPLLEGLPAQPPHLAYCYCYCYGFCYNYCCSYCYATARVSGGSYSATSAGGRATDGGIACTVITLD